MRTCLVAFSIAVLALLSCTDVAWADESRPCANLTCVNAGASGGNVAIEAAYVSPAGGVRAASNSPPAPQLFRWRLQTPCQIDDANLGACQPGVRTCPEVEGRVIGFYVVQHQRLAQEDRQVIDGQAPLPDVAVGAAYGPWVTENTACVDVTELNPAPTPEEVFRYFQTLPLPQLTTVVQPPGGRVLVGLPTIFYTDAPTEQVFTVDIRGFAVVITAGAESFAWHTGDGGAVVTSEGPGAAYPDQTVTYDYTSGTYSTYVTVTWGGTFTVDGSAQVAVAGTTTTDGPAVQLTAVQAHAVLTDPYD